MSDTDVTAGDGRIIYSANAKPRLRSLARALLAIIALGGTGCGAAASATPGTITIRDTAARVASHTTFLFDFDGSDGSEPYAGLISDGSGALYGTTRGGGDNGDGTVFKLTPTGTGYSETVLYQFHDGADGQFPNAQLLLGKDGSLYGTTVDYSNVDIGGVFKLAPTASGPYSESIIHIGDSAIESGLIADRGALFGTTSLSVFELTPSPTGYLATTIYTFNGSSDGLYPYAGVVADRSGSLYGTTTQGGYREGECAQTNGCGVVYKLTRSGRRFSESIIWAFHGGKDGAFPYAGLLMDQTGALFGTTYEGGLRQCSTRPSDYVGCGTVFKLTPSGSGYTKTRLYAFKGGTDGAAPFSANLIADLEGALYGTTVAGGSAREGTAFKLTPVKNGYRESVLASFDQSGGYLPYGALLLGPNNSLYGTTVAGGDPCTCGTLYEIAQ